MEDEARRTSRFVVLDGDDRALLFLARAPNGDHAWWTPGGGVEDGETPADGARRELAEETMLRRSGLRAKIKNVSR